MKGKPSIEELQLARWEARCPLSFTQEERAAAKAAALESCARRAAERHAAARAAYDAALAARVAARRARWEAKQRFQLAAEATIASQAVHAPVPEAIEPRGAESPRVAPEPVTRGRTRAQAQAPEASPDPPFLETWRRWRRAKLAGDPAARDLKRTLTELASLPE